MSNQKLAELSAESECDSDSSIENIAKPRRSNRIIPESEDEVDENDVTVEGNLDSEDSIVFGTPKSSSRRSGRIGPFLMNSQMDKVKTNLFGDSKYLPIQNGNKHHTISYLFPTE